MKGYLEILERILKEGEFKPNRTGIRTKSISGAMLEHDMSKGFPLLTTKHVSLKMIAIELEGFIKGITDKRWYQERGCHIWDEWHSRIHKNFLSISNKEYAKEDNDLGPIYGYNWRGFGKKYRPIPTIHTIFDKHINIEKNDEFVGYEFNGKFGNYIVETMVENKKGFEPKYEIIFTKTGYRNIYRKSSIINDNVKDKYYPNVCNVACIGNYKIDNIDRDFIKELMKTWRRIINRCYNEKHDSYRYYGFEGVYVCNKWLIFENFLNDVINMVNWDKKQKDFKNWTIERIDINDSYSFENCIWLHKKDQIKNRRNSLYYNIYDKNDNLIGEDIYSVDVCKIIKIPYCSLIKYADKKRWNGYFLKTISKEKNINTEGIDQLINVLEKLKIDPSDRRMIVSAWNPKELDQMALPPCHLMFQVVCTGENLETVNLNWYQRSCDYCLGIPYNIASYSLLLQLIALETGKKPGRVCGMLGDVHVYENHIETAKIQLEREPMQLPTLEIPNFNGVLNWTADQFIVHDYKNHGKLKYEIAV